MSKLCECGCGKPTKLASKTRSNRGWIKDQPLRFLNGHNNVHEDKPNSKITKECTVCNKSYEVFPSRSESVVCSNKCGRVITAEKLSANEGHIRKTSKGYLQIKVSDHPYCDSKGYVMYHRYLMELHLGHFITPEFDVHHKDENTTNNDLDNLEVMTRSDHMRYHMLKHIREGTPCYLTQ